MKTRRHRGHLRRGSGDLGRRGVGDDVAGDVALDRDGERGELRVAKSRGGRFVEVGAAFPAESEAAEEVQPGEGPLDDPAAPFLARSRARWSGLCSSALSVSSGQLGVRAREPAGQHCRATMGALVAPSCRPIGVPMLPYSLAQVVHHINL